MQNRILGRSGLAVSALGMGCWAIGGDAWGEVDDAESMRALHRAVDLGVTLFDTANVYGLGHSEVLVGRALADVRGQVMIATKFGNTFDEDTGERTGQDASPEAIRRSCEDSLRRLQTDVIDLFQFHLGSYALEAAISVRETLEALVWEGKIRFYGWSTDGPERARLFAEGEHCVAVQQRLNLFEGNPATLAVCEEENLASINRGPLAMGLLTGKYTADSQLPQEDIRGRGVEWVKSFQAGRPNPEWLAKLEQIRAILTSDGRTPAQGALAWLWGLSERTIPVPGFKNVRQVEENAAAMAHGPLTPEQMTAIHRILAEA